MSNVEQGDAVVSPPTQSTPAAFPAVYFRADYVAVALKNLSVRDIAPLP